METTAKTLGESYEGCLSRDWPKLIQIFKDGEKRVLLLLNSRDGRSYPSSDIYAGPKMLEFLESHCIGWFPTKGDFPAAPSVEPAPLEWHHYEMNEEAVATIGTWQFYAWWTGSWAVMLNSVELANEEGPTQGNFDTAKAQIHEWRVNHLNSMIKK